MTTAMKATFVLLVLSAITSPVKSEALLQLDMETGLVISGYNDVRIPGDTGTEISLSKELPIDPTSFFRISLFYRLGDRNSLGLLLAPLRLEARGSVDRPVQFHTAQFPANTVLRARYRFDSYRLTYRYDFYHGDHLQAGAGLTAKVRDASISLEGDGRKAEKKNTGFVPLVNFRLHWMMATEFSLLLEGDALAAPQGRAEDILLALCYWPDEHLGLKLGYRVLEGGADNDEVYNFTLVHYLVAGAIVSF
jgi:hypothetical protein